MTPEQFSRSLDFLIPYLSRLGFTRGGGQAVSLQYVGGEILTVPSDDLKRIVFEARSRMGAVFDIVRDGVQSNLIGSPARLAVMTALFGDRIGTSVDHFGMQRTLSGSAEKYRVISINSADRMRRSGRSIPAIFVVDAKGIKHVMDEYKLAEEGAYPLTMRAVFAGGRGSAEAPPGDVAATYGAVFDAWAMQGRVNVEPLGHLLRQRLAAHDPSIDARAMAGCPFQSNCAEVSLNLDPNGDLFLCLDTSDSGQMKLGNALDGSFDWGLWEQMKSRTLHLDSSCKSCLYRAQCAGGCMSEGYHVTGSPFGKTGLCIVWKTIFAKIDTLVEREGVAAVSAWAAGLI
jgi:radical SAM protein with 4Fe4S-binding SPASM domain